MARPQAASAVYKYIEDLYTSSDPALEKLRAELPEHKFAIQVSPLEGKLISILLKLHNAKRVLEIGTLAGYSTLWIAKALPSDGCVHTIEKSTEHFLIAQKNIKNSAYSSNIIMHNGAGLEIIETLHSQEPFDAIFIDADKVNYPNYLNATYPLLKTGGLIIADNTRLFDLVLSDEPPAKNPELWEAMRLFNKMLSDETKFNAVMIPTHEGLSIAIKN